MVLEKFDNIKRLDGDRAPRRIIRGEHPAWSKPISTQRLSLNHETSKRE
jgi:hypothetical protein